MGICQQDTGCMGESYMHLTFHFSFVWGQPLLDMGKFCTLHHDVDFCCTVCKFRTKCLLVSVLAAAQ
uniref:Uncharacterized protein n=1 Tax=Arundo donax TaxID=35708 RepID=A0A0A9SDJ1_ARUDO